ncbi:MAG: hydrogenase maturation protease [Nitrospinaceae bacterium]|jgi:hydrogenase maturation protease|nr:MAG: hydrogenase maturation protease [Nitrospinaceae bacterium]
MNPPPLTCLIGIGHPYRGDDQAGLRVARRLKAHADAGLEIVEHTGEAAGLMALFEGRDSVILVDAVSSGQAPGSLLRFDAARNPLPAGCFGTSTHYLGVAEAIEWARALGRLPQVVQVYGIEGVNFSPGGALSKQVEEAVDRLVREILSERGAIAGGKTSTEFGGESKPEAE